MQLPHRRFADGDAFDQHAARPDAAVLMAIIGANQNVVGEGTGIRLGIQIDLPDIIVVA